MELIIIAMMCAAIAGLIGFIGLSVNTLIILSALSFVGPAVWGWRSRTITHPGNFGLVIQVIIAVLSANIGLWLGYLASG